MRYMSSWSSSSSQISSGATESDVFVYLRFLSRRDFHKKESMCNLFIEIVCVDKQYGNNDYDLKI
jgi:hypothetical protein